MNLFDTCALPDSPLAERLRPKLPDQVLGQASASRYLDRMRKGGAVQSLILWGPPGTGKTSFARSIMNETNSIVVSGNATDLGSKELRNIGQEAQKQRQLFGKKSVLFIDEIHRLNKAQQDMLLPFLENGALVLIGATTENPSYELNKAILSRCHLIVFQRLKGEVLEAICSRAMSNLNLSLSQVLENEALQFLIQSSDGDARKLLAHLEQLVAHWNSNQKQGEKVNIDPRQPLSLAAVVDCLGDELRGYSSQGDEHYDLLSALIKSVRGSDPDAGLYYLARMLRGGEPPLVIARRLIVLASEDIGNADPRALAVAVAGAQAVELVGLPECSINLAQVVTYLASAPKSNRTYLAIRAAEKLVESYGSIEVPKALRSAKTEAMARLGYGEGYLYPHDQPKGYSGQVYMPSELADIKLYQPSERGFEKQILEYRKWLKN